MCDPQRVMEKMLDLAKRFRTERPEHQDDQGLRRLQKMRSKPEEFEAEKRDVLSRGKDGELASWGGALFIRPGRTAY